MQYVSRGYSFSSRPNPKQRLDVLVAIDRKRLNGIPKLADLLAEFVANRWLPPKDSTARPADNPHDARSISVPTTLPLECRHSISEIQSLAGDNRSMAQAGIQADVPWRSSTMQADPFSQSRWVIMISAKHSPRVVAERSCLFSAYSRTSTTRTHSNNGHLLRPCHLPNEEACDASVLCSKEADSDGMDVSRRASVRGHHIGGYLQLRQADGPARCSRIPKRFCHTAFYQSSCDLSPPTSRTQTNTSASRFQWRKTVK